jgi:hypothetical protein
MSDLKDATSINEIEMNIEDVKYLNKDEISIDNSYENTSEAYLKSFKKKKSLNLNDNEVDTNNDHPFVDNNLYVSAKNYTIMNKLLKEQNIHSDPKDYYKRRTIIISRKLNNFGFDLQVILF